MNAEKQKPYLTGCRCGRCITPLETTERRESGTLYVTYVCTRCGVRTVVTFPPAKLAEWERRKR
jgi:hypothetical protein